jgi:hypothetical protein
LRPLPEKFDELERLLLSDRTILAQNRGVPFMRLVYRPDEEGDCTRRRDVLKRALEGRNIPVALVSCRDVMFAHYERRNRLEQLFQLEATAGDQLAENIAGHAKQELMQRILAAAHDLGTDGVIFLTDVAFLYPYLHLGTVLDDCTNCIRPPMVLVIFYPGEVDVEGRLKFLGIRPTSYYRTRDLI